MKELPTPTRDLAFDSSVNLNQTCVSAQIYMDLSENIRTLKDFQQALN